VRLDHLLSKVDHSIAFPGSPRFVWGVGFVVVWGAGFVWVRCWVLRKRAPSLFGGGCVFSGSASGRGFCVGVSAGWVGCFLSFV
jgi:hypothetical protein